MTSSLLLTQTIRDVLGALWTPWVCCYEEAPEGPWRDGPSAGLCGNAGEVTGTEISVPWVFRSRVLSFKSSLFDWCSGRNSWSWVPPGKDPKQRDPWPCIPWQSMHLIFTHSSHTLHTLLCPQVIFGLGSSSPLLDFSSVSQWVSSWLYVSASLSPSLHWPQGCLLHN